MNSGYKSSAPRLEIRASKSAAIFSICIYVCALFFIPVLGWLGFGPGAPGDTVANGNSLWAFWVMRIILAAMWVATVRGLVKSWLLLRELPVLYVLDKTGITDRKGISTPWVEFRYAYHVCRAWTFNLDVPRKSQFKNFVLKDHEIGDSGIEEVKTFMRHHAPDALTRDI